MKDSVWSGGQKRWERILELRIWGVEEEVGVGVGARWSLRMARSRRRESRMSRSMTSQAWRAGSPKRILRSSMTRISLSKWCSRRRRRSPRVFWNSLMKVSLLSKRLMRAPITSLCFERLYSGEG